MLLLIWLCALRCPRMILLVFLHGTATIHLCIWSYGLSWSVITSSFESSSLSSLYRYSYSWTTSLVLYLKPVMIWPYLLPANFQLTMTSSSWTTSISFFIGRLSLLLNNLQMTMKSSSHDPVFETTSKEKSLLKISRAIILFISEDNS